MISLSAADARRMALRAQCLLGAPDRRAGVSGLLRHLGAVQLDTISVLARSHELVPFARLGPVGRAAVESAYWGDTTNGTVRAFEYWAHAACVLPAEEWPWFAFRRRSFRKRGLRWHEVPEAACAEVLARLRSDGPLTATQLGGAKRDGPWWDWSEVKIAVEWLLDIGEVICVERRGWKRVYELPERVLPSDLLGQEPTDEECHVRLVGLAGWALGVADSADLADYHRLTRDVVAGVVSSSGLIPVAVEGWPVRAWAHPEALTALDTRGRHRTTLLSPFDSLIWDRRRTLRLFGFAHALESYKPRDKRRYGYYAMPLLSGGRLLGRVDPKRVGRTLVAQHATLDTPHALTPMAIALKEAAQWVDCDDLRIDRVTPDEFTTPLRHAVLAV